MNVLHLTTSGRKKALQKGIEINLTTINSMRMQENGKGDNVEDRGSLLQSRAIFRSSAFSSPNVMTACDCSSIASFQDKKTIS
jgi:hypothetical protein